MKTITKIPCKCPICDGVGQVPGGYYNRIGVNEWASTTVAEVCRQCNGTGIIYGEQITEYEPCPPKIYNPQSNNQRVFNE